ncbi:hypothetical protein PENSPDRAFT_646361 [Peniophora sp. CONT]|nr:hypothetical protein PENSPDRAFT_646361 [Peniophora sp. CONT]
MHVLPTGALIIRLLMIRHATRSQSHWDDIQQRVKAVKSSRTLNNELAQHSCRCTVDLTFRTAVGHAVGFLDALPLLPSAGKLTEISPKGASV